MKVALYSAMIPEGKSTKPNHLFSRKSMSSIKKPLILVDGSSYLYRAYHALPALQNSKGMPTGAIYGVVNMLKRLLNDYQPTHMAVVFDAKGKTFRDELYKEYKANRPSMPDELISQIEPLHALIQDLGIPILMVDGVEADDVIGTLAKNASKDGIETLISTGDKDLAQLVNLKVSLVNTMTNTFYNPEAVKEKFGVAPEQIIDYLTLVGDASDNIRGVPQVGPKTAVKWLTEFGNLTQLIQNAEKISGKVGENLRNAIPEIPHIKNLVTIKCDVLLPITLHDLTLKSPSKAALMTHYKKLEFKSWLAELLKETSPDKDFSHYRIITRREDLHQFLQSLASAKVISFKLMTSPTNYMEAQLTGVAIAQTQEAVYIPLGPADQDPSSELSKAEILHSLRKIFENSAIKKVGHDLKYNFEVLANHEILLQGLAFDTMLESYLLDSANTQHQPQALALKYLGTRLLSFEEIAGKGAKQVSIAQIDITKAGTYCAEEALHTLKIHALLWPRIEENAGLKHIFSEIEMPLIPVLAAMEIHGVLIDPKLLEKHAEELKERLNELEKEIYQTAGKTFNINSPKQLQEILFDVLKLPVIHKTPTGQPSTADNVLQELALEFTIGATLIKYRSLNKLMSTYTHRLIEQLDPRTHRLHTSYHQTATATGRLSSSEPNLQNIPIKSVEGRRIRQAFIAERGYKILSADYSQIELRLMAHISKDPNLLYAFAENLDVHKATAAEVWGVSLDQVTPTMRRNAKAINFGLIYGMSAFGLSQQLGIDRQAAQEYIDRYFLRYPLVKTYMESTRALAKAQGYVETLWGRRIYLPDIHSSQHQRQKAAERAAINGPLQGSAADIIKHAMLLVDRFLKKEGAATKMIMQVHDELVFEAPLLEIESITSGIKQQMSQAISLSVPLLVSTGIGDNWDAASSHA